ncbi:ketopantoate reductase family protein [Flavisphingomonas formosensis]|uniref:ketopantoate reductase family protein n=1 Tax=Flavisphingomonas formosensis TaxID=861534 RepID=UPI0012F75C8C|nr:2-dehydropantoate 2-reductase [Sphingomonas formosensis]
MRTGIVGAGAIGCALAARLAHAGHDVSLVVRKRQRRDALAADGITCVEAGARIEARPRIVEKLPLVRCDVLFLALKAATISDAVATLPDSIDRDTLIVPLVNGIPWWFPLDGGAGARPVRAVDPQGALLRRFVPGQIAGSVVYTTAMIVDSACVRVTRNQRLILGAIDGRSSDRIAALAAELSAAGIETSVSDRIRDDVWTKVALNLATNPLSVVSGAYLGQLCSDPHLEPVVSTILDEVWRVAGRYDARPPLTRTEMLDRGRQAGAFRTSMLEDYRAGRPLELDSIADAVFELAAAIGLDLPISRAIVELARYRSAASTLPEKI